MTRRRDRRRDAALRRGARARFDRRARAGARARAQLRRGDRRRADRHEGAALGRHDRRVHRRSTADSRPDQSRRPGSGPDACATSSPSISKSGFTSAASARARARALGSPAVARRARRRGGCSTCSTRPASAPRSSSSAGSPSGIRELVDAVRARRPRDRIARLRCTSGSTTSARERFARDLRASVARAAAAPAWPTCALPRARVVDQRPVALGARRARGRGLHARRQHGAAAGSSATSRYPRYPHVQDDAGRTDPRSAAARGRSVRAGDADGLGLGTAHELAAPGASRDRGGEPRGPAGGADGASVGTRPDPPRVRAAAAAALRALLPARRISRSGCARFCAGAAFGPLGGVVDAVTQAP